MKRIEERTAVSEKRALNQLLGQNRFLTEQLSNLSKRVIDGEKRHKDGKLERWVTNEASCLKPTTVKCL